MDNCGRRFSILDHCRVKTASVATLSGHGNDAFIVTQRHLNFTSHNINIKTRLGMNVMLKPTSNDIYNERIEVQIDWQMSGDTFKRAEQDLCDKNLNPDTLTGMILRAVDDRHPRNHKYNQVSAVVIVTVSFKDLVNAGGVIYLEELDLLISIGEPQNDRIDHPFSPNERLRAGLAASIPHLGKETFLMSVKAVDNNPIKKHHDRFLLIGDEVHHIPIEVDPSLDTGVYITTRLTADRKIEKGGQRVEMQFLTYEDADKRFGFATSIETAKSGGNWEGVYKDAFTRKQWEQKLREQELRDRALDREEEINDTKHRYYRERSQDDYKREEVKNFGDWMRIIGVTITAVCTFAGILAKMKPT